MNITSLIISVGSMGGLGLLFSAGLALANKKLYVEEDPRIAEVEDFLPGANCGGCGYPGCKNFAENVVLGNTEISDCSVAAPEDIAAIGEVMGVETEAAEKQIAVVMCQGGIEETAQKAEYYGIESCLAVNLTGGGEKLCSYGCVGFGDCIDECPFDAMYMGDNGLPVILEDKCTGCGKCAEACPRDVIEMHPVSHQLFVLCKNHDDPKYSRQVCTKACIGCQICVRAIEEGGMYMDDNLAMIQYEKYGTTPELPTDRCPTDCLVVFDHRKDQDRESSRVEEVAA